MTRDIETQLQEIYGVGAGRDLIDAVIAPLAGTRQKPQNLLQQVLGRAVARLLVLW